MNGGTGRPDDGFFGVCRRQTAGGPCAKRHVNEKAEQESTFILAVVRCSHGEVGLVIAQGGMW